MPYFIILPIYALLLAFLVSAAILARCVESWRPASGYLVGGTVGSFLGFIVANVIVTLAGILPVLVARHLTPPQWLQQAGAVVVAAILLVGPFIASAMHFAWAGPANRSSALSSNATRRDSTWPAFRRFRVATLRRGRSTNCSRGFARLSSCPWRLKERMPGDSSSLVSSELRSDNASAPPIARTRIDCRFEASRVWCASDPGKPPLSAASRRAPDGRFRPRW